MTTDRRIALLSRDPILAEALSLRLQSRGDHVLALSDGSEVLGVMFVDPPDLVVVDLSANNEECFKLLQELRDDSYFSPIPIIGLVKEAQMIQLDWETMPIDDFVTMPIPYPELFSRIGLAQQRLRRVFDNNPLTRLPGNTSIQRAIEQILGKEQAVCYLDIDHFKPFNDHFGFDRGDEILRMLARIMSNAVKEGPGGGFAGHIGGDDFVFIVPRDRVAPVCQTIISRFTLVVSDFFAPADRASGYYLARDRQGTMQHIPLPSISIGVAMADNPTTKHAAELIAVATAMKYLAKRTPGSCFIVDRRDFAHNGAEASAQLAEAAI